MMALTADATASQSDHSLQGTSRAKAFMKVYGKTLPPIGHVQFCQRHTQECGNGSGIAKRVKLSDVRWDELVKVNDYVNRRIEPVTDQDLYNTPENWTYPDRYGDCEDYVLLKQRYLINLGWPVEALLITVVRDHNNEGHAVLTVATDVGDFILDNQNPDILPWHTTGYTYYKRQSQKHPFQWVSVRRGAQARANTVTGVR